MQALRQAKVVGWLVTALFICGCEKTAEPATPPAPRIDGDSIVFAADAVELQSVHWAEIHMQPIPPTSLNGRVTWNEDKTVRVFSPFGGRVETILARAGQKVAAGAALAIIASPDFGQAQADADRAESEFALARKNLERTRELERNGVLARKDLNVAEAEHARANAELLRARKRLLLYGGTGRSIDNRFTLSSPISGTVVERNINPGQEVRSDQSGPGAPALFVITDPTSLWVQLDAAEKDIPLLRSGKRIDVRSAAYPEHSFPATIETVADFLDQTTHTVKVRAAADNKERLLKGDMFVQAIVDYDGAKELLVPAKALYFQNEKHYVFVAEGNGRFTRRAVRVGDVRGHRTEILDGLRDGDSIVTEGALMLQQVLKPRRVQK